MTLPMLVIAPREIELAIRYKRNPIPMLPTYLEYEKSDADHPVLRRLMTDGITYQVHDLPDAEYLVRSRTGAGVAALKRLTVFELALAWRKQSFDGVENQCRNLMASYTSQRIELMLEDYYGCQFDNQRECIWAPSRVQYSDKTDPNNAKPKYLFMTYKRIDIAPATFMDAVHHLEAVGIQIRRFQRAEELYQYIRFLIHSVP